MSSPSKLIYVVGAVTPGSSGMFEWRWYRDESERDRAQLTATSDVISPVREVIVPDDVRTHEITDWLNENPDLWEPDVSGGEQ